MPKEYGTGVPYRPESGSDLERQEVDGPRTGRRAVLAIVAGAAVAGTLACRMPLPGAGMQVGMSSGGSSSSPGSSAGGAYAPDPAAAQGVPRRRPGGDNLAGWHASWQSWSRRFLLPDGRVVDSGNGGVSHSEGQSYGLLFAEASGDRAAFDRILQWTSTNLTRSDDTLMPWRYRPGVSVPVDDPNNATDGDLVFAWALARGAARWKDATLARRSQAMASDIASLLVHDAGGRQVLLPGAQGFQRLRGSLVNPSYYAYAAMRDLARGSPLAGGWSRLEADGVELAGAALFGTWNLPADWLWVPNSGASATWAPDMPPRFSYDAIRIPIHLAWSGYLSHPALRSAAAFLTRGRNAAWADLRTGSLSPEGQSAGHRAVAVLANACVAGRLASVRFADVSEAADYYAASLNMLCRLAAAESAQV